MKVTVLEICYVFNIFLPLNTMQSTGTNNSVLKVITKTLDTVSSICGFGKLIMGTNIWLSQNQDISMRWDTLQENNEFQTCANEPVQNKSTFCGVNQMLEGHHTESKL